MVDTEPSLPPTIRTLEPVFEDEAVTIVLSANDVYVPYVSALLQSIKDNSSEIYNYDIIITHTDISPGNQDILINQVTSDNMRLRFFDVGDIMARYTNLYIHGHFKIETYFRLLIPDILPDYSKALYLDSDLVVLRDVALLYATDIEDYLVAATKDADTAGMYNGYDPTTKEYMDSILKIAHPFDYFQAGVILMNLDRFRARYSSEEMLEFASSYQWNLQDQDVLNYLAQGYVRFVDMAWNTMMDWQGLRRKAIIRRAPEPLRLAYDKARRNPYIVHYAGPGNKPWEYRNADMGEYFWYYARRCPFYDAITSQLHHITFSVRGELKLIGQFWIFRVGMRLANALLPPGSKRRRFCYRIYKKIGGPT